MKVVVVFLYSNKGEFFFFDDPTFRAEKEGSYHSVVPPFFELGAVVVVNECRCMQSSSSFVVVTFQTLGMLRYLSRSVPSNARGGGLLLLGRKRSTSCLFFVDMCSFALSFSLIESGKVKSEKSFRKYNLNQKVKLQSNTSNTERKIHCLGKIALLACACLIVHVVTFRCC